MEYQNVQASVNFSHLIIRPGILPCLCNRPILFVSSRGTPCSYNCHNHVPSDIATDNIYLDASNINSQEYMNRIENWTESKQMKLNTKKTNYMIFNFSTKYQFNTRLRIENSKIDQIKETRLLGLILRDDLAWKSNTEMLTKRAYTRLIIIKKLIQFDVTLSELIEIYILYIRSVVEQSAVVWHSSITKGEKNDLERTQKVALRVILGDAYCLYYLPRSSSVYRT